ncbi:MAG TPA: hypothetical protein VHM31_11230 [Polyangia bacterium]|nr:hypothetical protein [Polyangia bacterium]
MTGCTDSVRSSPPVFASTGGGGHGGVAGGSGGASGGSGAAAGSPATGPGGSGSGGQTAQGGQAGQPTTTGDGGGVVATGGNGGGAGSGGRPPVLVPPAPHGLVSVNSDGDKTSLSLLATSGASVMGDCVHSLTQANGISKNISGDVVLPSQPQRGGDVVLVDRGNGMLTFVDPAGCFIARLIAIPGGAGTAPHDVVTVSDRKAYVTRNQATPAAAGQPAAGNDVITIDPTNGNYLGRIALDAYGSKSAGAQVQARPDRALIADGRVVVSLNESDAARAMFGDGAVVIIDPASDAVLASVALPGLYDCEGMSFFAASHMLLVACGGGAGGRDQPLQSGIAVVDLGATPPRLDHVVSSVAFNGRPLSAAWVLSAPSAASPNRAFAATTDPQRIAPDAVFAFDFASGAVTPVITAVAASVGSAAIANQLLFVPEALPGAPKVQLVDVTSAPRPTTGFTPDPKSGLPPRAVGWY